jgi:hypothetical protein
MTYYFAVVVLEAWRQRGQPITYRQAHEEASKRLLKRFPQHPQLEGPDRLKDLPVFGYVPERRRTTATQLPAQTVVTYKV